MEFRKLWVNTTDLHETFIIFDLDDIQLKGKTVPVKNQHSLFVILSDYLEFAQALGLHSA